MNQRKPFIAGNWKMNLSLTESVSLVRAIAENIRNLEATEMSKPIIVFSVAVVFGSTSACFEDTPGLFSEFEVDTVGSVLITRNLAGEPFPAPESVSPKEVFRIGSASGVNSI